jgi:hypothetical protein
MDSNRLLHKANQYTSQGSDLSTSKTAAYKYIVNNGMSINFKQENVSLMISVVFTLLYL